jgi:hypothetical protein
LQSKNGKLMQLRSDGSAEVPIKMLCEINSIFFFPGGSQRKLVCGSSYGSLYAAAQNGGLMRRLTAEAYMRHIHP